MINGCYGCKRHQASAFAQPFVGNLPKNRTEGSWPFHVISIDYAGPRVRTQEKSYSLLYVCSLFRALYLELLLHLTTKECIRNIKRFIARRGRPERIYPDRREMATDGSKERTVSGLASKAENCMAIQPKQIPLLGRLIRKGWWGW